MVSEISSAIFNDINWLTTPEDHVYVLSVSVAYVASFNFTTAAILFSKKHEILRLMNV